MARNLRPGARWITGVIVKKLGPMTYLIQVETGQLWKRHVDHLRTRGDKPLSEGNSQTPTQTQNSEWDFASSVESDTTTSGTEQECTTSDTPITDPSVSEPCYPHQQRQAPDRYM